MPVLSCDVGSLPLAFEPALLERGALDVLSPGRASSGAALLFKRAVISALKDKLSAGLDVPTYPQFRGMNDMFLSMFYGIEELEGRYVEVGHLGVRDARIPEVHVIEGGAKEIAEFLGLEKLRLRVCLTGPHTLSFCFAFRSPGLLARLGHVLAEVTRENAIRSKHLEVAILALDEPTFGTVDDLLIEPGSEGREELLRAWEEIMGVARARGAVPCLHLHSTSDGLFWHVEPLRLIESHVDDPLYRLAETKTLLDEHDKVLKASICRTDFDLLVRERLKTEKPGASEAEISERVGEAWKAIKAGRLEPSTFLEPVELLLKRLKKVIERFGPERIPFAGPECGLRAFPTYGVAIECLRRVARTCKMV